MKAIEVKCPVCGALPNHPCYPLTRNPAPWPMSGFHLKRKMLAKMGVACQPTLANVAVVDFDSPHAKDEFIRGLAATAKADGNVREYILAGADPSKVN